MKKLVLGFLFFVIFGLFLGSCKKSELVSVPIDTESVRAMLIKVSTPTKKAVQTMLTATPITKLKDGVIANQMLVEIFALDARTFEVYDDYAVKNFVYYEIDQNGYRQKLLGIQQKFQVKGGVVDTTSSVLSYEVGCSYSRYFNLTNQWNISRVTYSFHFDNGRQFSYFGENTGNIKLPPIGGGKWQLDVIYDDGDLRQEFISNLVDFYADSNMLSLRLGIQKENTVSFLQLSKDFIRGSYLIQLDGEDGKGNSVYLIYPVIFDEGMPATLSFSAPFEVKGFIMCGSNGCYWHDVKLSSTSPTNGPKIYIPKN